MAKRKILDEDERQKQDIKSQMIKQYYKDLGVSSRKKPIKQGKLSNDYIADVIQKQRGRSYSESYLKKLIAIEKRKINKNFQTRFEYLETYFKDIKDLSDREARDLYYRPALESFNAIAKYGTVDNKLLKYILENDYFDEFLYELDNQSVSDQILKYSPEKHSYNEYIKKYSAAVGDKMANFVASKVGLI